VKKNLIISTLIKLAVSEINSKEDQKKALKDINQQMEKKFGDDWNVLPFGSIQSIIAIFIMNKALTPYDITPRRISELSLVKAKEMGLDKKSKSLLEDVKKSGEFTQDRMQEFLDTAEKSGKSTFGFISDIYTVSKDATARSVSKGVGSVKRVVRKSDDQPKLDK
jgi:hypothetical protein